MISESPRPIRGPGGSSGARLRLIGRIHERGQRVASDGARRVRGGRAGVARGTARGEEREGDGRERRDRDCDGRGDRGANVRRPYPIFFHTRFAHSRARFATSASSTFVSRPSFITISPDTITPVTGARSSPVNRCSTIVRDESSVAGR